LKPIEEAIKNVQRGTDRTAAELAIRRLVTEIPSLEREIEERKSRIWHLESEIKQSQLDLPSTMPHAVLFLFKWVVIVISTIVIWRSFESVLVALFFIVLGPLGILALQHSLTVETSWDRIWATRRERQLLELLRTGAGQTAAELTEVRKEIDALYLKLGQRKEKLASAREIVNS